MDGTKLNALNLGTEPTTSNEEEEVCEPRLVIAVSRSRDTDDIGLVITGPPKTPSWVPRKSFGMIRREIPGGASIILRPLDCEGPRTTRSRGHFS